MISAVLARKWNQELLIRTSYFMSPETQRRRIYTVQNSTLYGTRLHNMAVYSYTLYCTRYPVSCGNPTTEPRTLTPWNSWILSISCQLPRKSMSNVTPFGWMLQQRHHTQSCHRSETESRNPKIWNGWTTPISLPQGGVYHGRKSNFCSFESQPFNIRTRTTPFAT